MFEDAVIETISENTNAEEKIKNTDALFPTKVPALLTTDEVIFELGKWVVQNANAEKCVDELNSRLTIAIKEYNSLKSKSLDLENKIEQLKDSNSRYDLKNKELNTLLSDLRKTINDLNIDKEKITKNISDNEKDIDMLKKDIKNKEKTISNLLKDVLDKDTNIENLNKENNELKNGILMDIDPGDIGDNEDIEYKSFEENISTEDIITTNKEDLTKTTVKENKDDKK